MRLLSSTFMTAMAAAASTVPGNSSAPGAAARSTSPAASATRAASRARSSPIRRASGAANPDTIPKQMTGVAASTDTTADDRCRRSCNSG